MGRIREDRLLDDQRDVLGTKKDGIFSTTLWRTYKKLLKLAIEIVIIVDFPSYKMVIFHCYVSSPEGN